MKIGIILGSVRPGRMGDRVAKMVSNELGMVNFAPEGEISIEFWRKLDFSNPLKLIH